MIKQKFDRAGNLVALSSLKLSENPKGGGGSYEQCPVRNRERKNNDFSHYLSCVTSNQPLQVLFWVFVCLTGYMRKVRWT